MGLTNATLYSIRLKHDDMMMMMIIIITIIKYLC